MTARAVEKAFPLGVARCKKVLERRQRKEMEGFLEKVAANGQHLNGEHLKEMFSVAAAYLEKEAAAINALNVFPVPDGDTGTNMLQTARAALEEAEQAPQDNASEVAQAMAHGALMGARGNSGVILSQFFRGLARGLSAKKDFGGEDLALALAEASQAAYRAVSRPVEGTILTVLREAAAAAQNGDGVASVLEAATSAAREAVIKTPTLLPVLREAGVVDAGGQGLYVILRGALAYLSGEDAGSDMAAPELDRPAPVTACEDSHEEPYGYCTEFLLSGQGLDLEEVRGRVNAMGVSTLVVGDEATLRVHVHTFDPGAVLSYATSLGSIRQVKVENMDDQHQEFLAAREAQSAGGVSLVAVAAGDGLKAVFQSLGVEAVVPGGQTMNPSTRELLEAVQSCPTGKVIILPNNKNIIPTAQQAASLTKKEVAVIPSRSIPEGIAALLAFNYEADWAKNLAAMEEAVSKVKTVEVTTAVRASTYDGMSVKAGQAIALLDGELIAAADDRPTAVQAAFEAVKPGPSSIITIYHGADATPAEAGAIVQAVRSSYPKAQVELIYGGQPHYYYIISVE